MKVLVDTNVILDSLLNRSAFSIHSKAIFDLAEQKRIIGNVSASAITDIFYIAYKEFKNSERVYNMVEKLTTIKVALVSETTIASALALRWRDFEDAVQYIVAKENNAAYIITRNIQDFSSGNIPAVTPEQFMQHIADMQKNRQQLTINAFV